MPRLTNEEIKKAAALLQGQKVRPLVVESDRHAKELFELTGEKWSVGDKFYQAYTEDGLITSRWQD